MAKDLEKCSLSVTDSLSLLERIGVKKINKENLAENGGQLHYAGILPHDYVALVKNSKGKVVSYCLLKDNFFNENDMYVMQVAVDNDYKGRGIGNVMYDYVFEHLGGYKYFSASVNENNTVSQKFHERNGFQYVCDDNLGRRYLRAVPTNINQTLSEAEPIEFELGSKKDFNKSANPNPDAENVME